MVSTGMIVLIGVVCLIAVVLTLYGMKQEEDKQKKYEESGDDVFVSELQRSHEYETKSLKSNLPSLIWIYVITIGLSLVALAYYIF